VRRHLASARRGIVFRADRGEQHVERRHAERETQRAIAVVGAEPVVARFQHERRGGQHRFVPGAADLKEDVVLLFELNLLVVKLARQEHRAVRGEKLGAAEAFEKPGLAGVQNRFHRG